MASVRKLNKRKLWQMLKHGLIFGIAIAAPGLYIAGWVAAITVFVIAFLVGFFTPPRLTPLPESQQALAIREAELDRQIEYENTRHERKLNSELFDLEHS